MMAKEETLKYFRDVAQDPHPYLAEWSTKSGKRVLGYFCINTPEELIHAAGFLPVRLTGLAANISLAARHLPSYICSLIQSSLEAALQGKLDYLQGTVFPHTCDSIQRLSDIWAINLSYPFHWDLILPVKLHTASARAYLLHELRRFKQGLEEFAGQYIKDDDLKNSFLLFNSLRSLLREIALLQKESKLSLSLLDFYALIKVSSLLDRQDFFRQLKNLLVQLREEKKEEDSQNHYIPLFLVGSICDHLPLFHLFPSCGAQIVGDDLCSGWRFIGYDLSIDRDPLEAIADRFLHRPPCPCKYNPQFDRADELFKRIKACQAQGVVFLLQKFCDPHGFDYPYLREQLTQENVPHLLLEIEPGSSSWAGMKTRLQAFVEALAEQF